MIVTSVPYKITLLTEIDPRVLRELVKGADLRAINIYTQGVGNREHVMSTIVRNPKSHWMFIGVYAQLVARLERSIERAR